jgi:uncharacterized membrane protein YphA (DoxX/SURF4 family)
MPGYATMLEDRLDGQLTPMAVLRALARPMLASIFIIQGYDIMRNPGVVAKKAEPVVRPIASRISIVPDDTEQAVRLNAAVQFGGGTLLAIGWLPRLSALAIAATLVPTTAAGHRFWDADSPEERAMQRIQFMKNLAMFGGLLIAAGDTAGRPSLAWRSRHAVKGARREVSRTAKAARTSGKAGAKAARLKARVSGA